jgi:hypothetical protein
MRSRGKMGLRPGRGRLLDGTKRTLDATPPGRSAALFRRQQSSLEPFRVARSFVNRRSLEQGELWVSRTHPPGSGSESILDGFLPADRRWSAAAVTCNRRKDCCCAYLLASALRLSPIRRSSGPGLPRRCIASRNPVMGAWSRSRRAGAQISLTTRCAPPKVIGTIGCPIGSVRC